MGSQSHKDDLSGAGWLSRQEVHREPSGLDPCSMELRAAGTGGHRTGRCKKCPKDLSGCKVQEEQHLLQEGRVREVSGGTGRCSEMGWG